MFAQQLYGYEPERMHVILGTREQQGEGDCLGVGVSELVLVEPREQKVLPVLPEPPDMRTGAAFPLGNQRCPYLIA